jgi:hypothetical protein
MIIMKLPEVLTEEFLLKVPLQRKKLDKLLTKGLITSYSLSLDHSTLWSTVPGRNENEVLNIITSLPLTKYMKLEIIELSFNLNARISQTAISLN